jgi:hypothetical protein
MKVRYTAVPARQPIPSSGGSQRLSASPDDFLLAHGLAGYTIRHRGVQTREAEMEIQTFFLAEQITRHADNRHDVQRAAVAYFECTPQTPFPVRFTLPGLILLRREGRSAQTPFTLRLDLVDEDGKPAGQPRHGLIDGTFPAGPRFFLLMGKIDLEFPRPGSYRLDITVDQELAGNVFSYDLDIWIREGP